MGAYPMFIATPKAQEVTFVNADGTTAKDLVSAGSNGCKIISISAVSDDTSSVNMRLFVHDGSTAYQVGTMRIPTLSGTDGAAAAISLLNHTAFPWLEDDRGFVIPTGYKLQVAPLATVTSAKTVTIVCLAGDY